MCIFVPCLAPAKTPRLLNLKDRSPIPRPATRCENGWFPDQFLSVDRVFTLELLLLLLLLSLLDNDIRQHDDMMILLLDDRQSYTITEKANQIKPMQRE